MRRLLIAVALGLIISTLDTDSVIANSSPENSALSALCKIGLKANGIWGSKRINEAIALLDGSSLWRKAEPDAQAYAYKLCNTGGYL